jgi:putative Ca2+/H+ antiporter (TMEM165/GDT1 family)
VSPGVVVTVFLLVAVAELPDKTMIATLVMGSRSRPVLVWLGAAAAFLVHVIVAVTAGRLLALLPHRTVEIVTTVLFFAGAVYLLVVPERAEQAKGAEEGARDLPERRWRVVGTAFVVILVGELGDLTQILILNLAAKYHQPASVFVGAYLALLAVAALGAFGGRALLRVAPLAAIRRVGGVVLLGFTAYGIYSLVR